MGASGRAGWDRGRGGGEGGNVVLFRLPRAVKMTPTSHPLEDGILSCTT